MTKRENGKEQINNCKLIGYCNCLEVYCTAVRNRLIKNYRKRN
jgi:pectin methylesterase-like acyl-CoA thioesterase